MRKFLNLVAICFLCLLCSACSGSGDSEYIWTYDERVADEEDTNEKLEIKLGTYIAEFDGISDDLYAYITLKPNNQAILNANFDLNAVRYEKSEPFKVEGIYKLVDTVDDSTGNIKKVTTIDFYFNDKLYQSYFVGERGDFFQDQIVVFTLQE